MPGRVIYSAEHSFSKPNGASITLLAGLGVQGDAHCGATVKHRSRVAQLHVGADVVLRLTGLRNPCAQIDKFQRGLMSAVLDRSPEGKLIRKSGVMSVVLSGGAVRPGDEIRIQLPATPHRELERV